MVFNSDSPGVIYYIRLTVPTVRILKNTRIVYCWRVNYFFFTLVMIMIIIFLFFFMELKTPSRNAHDRRVIRQYAGRICRADIFLSSAARPGGAVTGQGIRGAATMCCRCTCPPPYFRVFCYTIAAVTPRYRIT